MVAVRRCATLSAVLILVVLVTVGLRLALAPGGTPGAVVAWSGMAGPQATPSVAPLTTAATVTPPSGVPGFADIAGRVLHRLNADTAATAVGQFTILRQLAGAVRDAIVGLISGHASPG